MIGTRYLTAGEAAAALGVSLNTLYAYVSRGLIRSESADTGSRARRYRAEDVEKLKARQEQRRNPAQAVEEALHWGAPVLESAITLISDGMLYYRGKSALELAERSTVEAVAALIWTGDPSDAGRLFTGPLEVPRRCEALAPQLAALPPFEALQLFLPLAAVDDLGALDLRPEAVARTGARLLRMMVAVAAHRRLEPLTATEQKGRGSGTAPGRRQAREDRRAGRTSPPGLAEILQQGWAPDRAEVAAPLSSALILCADHELNVSSFTARCIASAGSTPYAVVIAGLAALQGVRHGGEVERVEAMSREAGSAAGVRAALASWMRRGEGLPGFGHRLYPEGDPRGQMLLELAERCRPRSPDLALCLELARQASALTGQRPSLDLGLVTLARTLELPPGSALALFALGRTIGWIGHALEQYQTGRLIRPRARYVGELPERG